MANANSYKEFSEFTEDLSSAGKFLTGGKQLREGDLAKGYFCAPTISDEVPITHRLWKHEMFLPITMITTVDSLDDAMKIANDVDYGLTAGFYGNKKKPSGSSTRFKRALLTPIVRKARPPALARLPTIWWMEGFGLNRQERGRALLFAVVYA